MACLFAPVGLAGCDEPLEVDVDVLADRCVAELAHRIEVRVQRDDGAVVEVLRSEGIQFPTGVRLRSADIDGLWRVVATLYDAHDVPLATSSASGTFAARSQPALVFTASCLGVRCSTDAETCSEGRCVLDSSAIESVEPPQQCPEWTFVDGDAAASAACGTFEQPCNDLGNAIRAIGAAGAIVNVRGDQTYAGSLRVGAGDSASPITVRAWPQTGTPTIDGLGAIDTVAVAGSHVTLQDLRIIGASEHGVSVNAGGVSTIQDGIIVRRCELTGNGSSESPSFSSKAGLIFNNGVRDFTVEDSLLRANGIGSVERTFGIYANKTEGGLLRRNVFENNTEAGLWIRESTGIVIQDNVFRSAGATGVAIFPLTEGRIENNRFCGHRDAALYIDSNRSVRVVANSLADNGTAIVKTNDGRVHIDHNLFAYNGDAIRLEEGAPPEDGVNAYFGNDAISVNFERSMPQADSADDPGLQGRDDCSLSTASELEFGAR